MSSLAAIGAITATVAYFSSEHKFNPDALKSLGYSVSATKLLDSEAIQDMSSDRSVNADVKVENTGDGPILTRITYYWQKSLSDTPTAIELNNENTELKVAGWNFSFVDGNKFVCDNGVGGSNSYYYKGIIGNGSTVQHLDEISYSGAGIYSSSTEYTTNDDGSGWASEVAGTLKGERQKYSFGSSTAGYLTVVVETIQATEANGAALTLPESATAETLKGYWNNLGKGNPATPGEV